MAEDDRYAFERMLDDWKRRRPFLSAEGRLRVAEAFETFVRTLEDIGASPSMTAFSPDPAEPEPGTELPASPRHFDAGPPVARFHLEKICLDTLSVICHRLVETFGFSLVWIGKVLEEKDVDVLAVAGPQADTFATRYGARWRDRSPEDSAIGRAIRHRAVQCMENGGEGREETFMRTMAVRSGLAVPLLFQGQVLGVLVLYSDGADFRQPDIVRWLEMVAEQISVIMTILRHGLQWSLPGAALASTDYPVCIADERGTIQWVNAAYSELMGDSAQAIVGMPLTRYWPAELMDRWSSASRALHHGQRWTTEFVRARKDGTPCTVEQVVTPLVDHRGRVTHFVVVCQDVTMRKQEQAEMLYQAHHDPLTGLPNRVVFQDRLIQAIAHARRFHRYVAVLFLDLDRFKCVNDECGHVVGDELLKTVGARLRQCVRATDTVARRSGDEFTMILQGLERVDDAKIVVRKIMACLAEPFRLNGQVLSVRTSLGLALFPLDATDPETLVGLADRAMYRAKKTGGQCWCLVSDMG